MSLSMVAGIAGWALAGLLIVIGEGRRRDEAKAHRQGVAVGRAIERRSPTTPDDDPDEGDELAAWGGAYPRIETPAADEAASTPSRR